MKGIIISGGLGTRLRPLTNVINKQFLPVYNKPLIFYPLELLIKAGITDILIVSGIEHSWQFLNFLGSGRDVGAKLTYRVQDEPKGIAQAVGLGEGFVGAGDKVVVILGDNIFEDVESVNKAIDDFKKQDKGAKVFLKKVSDPERFGVATMKGKLITGIQEKPKRPKSDLAVTGLYMYDDQVFDLIRTLEPSDRGELEITDLNNRYIKQGTMSYQIVKGAWIDAGTFDSLLKAGNLLAKKAKR